MNNENDSENNEVVVQQKLNLPSLVLLAFTSLALLYAAYTPYSTRVFLVRLTRSDAIRVNRPDR
jgi:hypothetical protein